MAEKNDKKVKGFRIHSESIALVEKLIKDSGKEDWEWFEEVVQKIASEELVLEKEGISVDLRKHFSSDVSAIKDAVNLIQSIFINQMNRIAVEKNNWSEHLQSIINEHEKKFNLQKDELINLQNILLSKDKELDDLQNNLLQSENKIVGFDKLETQLRKDIERLENDKEKSDDEIKRLREEFILAKEEFQKSFEEIRIDHKTEKDNLNQQIVDLVNKLKETESISEENKKLHEEVENLKGTVKSKNRDYEINLTRSEEQAEINKEKALLIRERELREEFHNQNRDDIRELYEKIEHLQEEIQKLRIENNTLKNQNE